MELALGKHPYLRSAWPWKQSNLNIMAGQEVTNSGSSSMNIWEINILLHSMQTVLLP